MKSMNLTTLLSTLFLICGMAILMTGCAQDQEAASTAAPDMKAFTEADEMPKPVNLPAIYEAIQYPKEMAKAGEGGQVIARILIDEEGNYMEHKVVKSSDDRLTQAIDPHVSKLTFKPAMKDGKPVKFWVTLPFSFQLSN